LKKKKKTSLERVFWRKRRALKERKRKGEDIPTCALVRAKKKGGTIFVGPRACSGKRGTQMASSRSVIRGRVEKRRKGGGLRISRERGGGSHHVPASTRKEKQEVEELLREKGCFGRKDSDYEAG